MFYSEEQTGALEINDLSNIFHAMGIHPENHFQSFENEPLMFPRSKILDSFWKKYNQTSNLQRNKALHIVIETGGIQCYILNAVA